MDESADALILKYMRLAEAIGTKYASRKSRLHAEAVAEAYFWLVVLFKEKPALYQNAESKERLVGTYVKRALIKYFERPERYSERLDVDKHQKNLVQLNFDEEMIDFLSGLTTDEEAYKVFQHIRSGIDPFDIDMVSPGLQKTLKRLRFQVSGRIRRLTQLKRLGYPTSREVIGASLLEDGRDGIQEVGDNPGEHAGRTDS